MHISVQPRLFLWPLFCFSVSWELLVVAAESDKTFNADLQKPKGDGACKHKISKGKATLLSLKGTGSGGVSTDFIVLTMKS